MNKLAIVGTPIGNIEDITIRAIKTIFEADVVLAEDTRVFRKLQAIIKVRFEKIFDELHINANKNQEVRSYRDQNHSAIMPWIVSKIGQEAKVILVSDSGMPAISDPGFKLIRDLINLGQEIEVIPGPTAVSSALLLSGLATDRYIFLGFMPRKTGKITELVGKYLNSEVTIIIYESPFRVEKTLRAVAEYCNKNNLDNIVVSLSNDITKLYEKTYRGKINQVLYQIQKLKLRGEWVMCIRNVN